MQIHFFQSKQTICQALARQMENMISLPNGSESTRQD